MSWFTVTPIERTKKRGISSSSGSSGHLNSKHHIDRNIINEVKDVLDTSSDLVKTFRRARDRYNEDNKQNIRIMVVAKRGKDGRTYNLPTANEVAGLIVGDFDTCVEQKDIMIEKHHEGLECINIFHPLYLALQYPLLMSCAQDGYHLDIPHRKKSGQPATGKKDKTVSMGEWFAYQIQDRTNQENLFVRRGHLFQQFLVDGYNMVKKKCFYFHRSKQSKVRCDTYSNIHNSIASRNIDPTILGKPVVLSSSFTGGPRYMRQNYMDVMALCRWYGCPTLFITITCNPNWQEIARYMQEHKLSSTDRPNVLLRVFKMKLDQLMKDIRELWLFGCIKAVVYTVEFQKRGLSHAHICLFLHKNNKVPNVEHIDKFISAEIRDLNDDIDLYNLFSDFMMHGPCSKDNPNHACIDDRKCTKHFPTNFTQRSSVDSKGYPVYRRRDDGKYVE
ncbi:hypothetical protein Tco_0026701 [Tanacetum coccineum]